MQVMQRAASGLTCSPSSSNRQSVVRNISSVRSASTRLQARPSAPFRHSQQRFQLQHAPSRGVACQGLFGLGLPEIAVIAGIAALVFGPSKLPELGKGLGQTVKSFQTAAKEFETELKEASKSDKADAPAATEESKKEVKKE